MGNKDNFEHLRKFGQKTSIKGVPRAINAEYGILQVPFTLGVIVLLAICIQQVWFLVRDYLEFETVTTYEEIPTVLIPPDSNVELPTMTFCNLDPIRGEPPNDLNIPTMDEYLLKVEEVMRCSNCTKDQKLLLENIKVDLQEPHGYYQYIGKDAASRVGHQEEDFIASCNLVMWDGTRVLSGRPCGNLVEIYPYVNGMYFNCFLVVIKGPSTNAKFIPVGLSMTFYLDTFRSEQFKPPKFNPAFGPGQSSGVLVDLNEDGALPLVEPHSRLLQPGTWSDVQFTISNTVRLPAPHGDCEYVNDLPVIKRGNFSLTYAANTCKRHCSAKLMIERCSCVDPITAQGLFTENETVPFCFSLHLPQEQLLRHLRCLEEHKFSIGSYCSNLEFCPQKCRRSKYETRVSQANWPMDTLVDSFQENMIKGKRFQRFFDPYFNTSRCENDSLCESVLHSSAVQMVRSNFLKCDVFLNADVQVLLKDSEKTSVVNLLSSLGGTLNLWSGITVIVLLELLDLIIRLCTGGNYSERKIVKRTNVQPPPNNQYSTDVPTTVSG